jgi:serine/threonine protein kinase
MTEDRYQLGKRIGQGGVGVVYKASDRHLNRDVAIKRILAGGGFENQDEATEAMIAAQDLDLVHRDTKPTNIMVIWLPSGRFQIKLDDFGLAKFPPKPSLQTIDHGDSVFGSIHFMAPEQFERTPLDKRTDMYSLGCVCYYCLTGRYPFDGENAAQVMNAHLQNDVIPIAELRPDHPPRAADRVMWHLSRKKK